MLDIGPSLFYCIVFYQNLILPWSDPLLIWPATSKACRQHRNLVHR